jgi:hypothetical protein
MTTTEERAREDAAIFRDAAMLLACLTDYVEGESISAQVWYQEFFWAISDIQARVTEIEPDYTDAALMILQRANERYPYRTRNQVATDPVVRLSGSNKSHGGGAVVQAAREIVGRMPQRPSPHGPRPAVMDESAPFAALWDAVQALDAPDGEGGE